jgi:hypothetical protein
MTDETFIYVGTSCQVFLKIDDKVAMIEGKLSTWLDEDTALGIVSTLPGLRIFENTSREIPCITA